MTVNRWIYINLSLLIITFALIAFFEIEPTAVINNTLFTELPISVFALLLIACLIMPVVEEFGFRYWTLAVGWKKYFSLLIALGLILSAGNLVLIIGFVIVVVYILFAKASTPFKAISSSVFFSLLHLFTDTFSLSFIAYFFVFFLFGSLFFLLYFKKGLWLSILVHIGYNSFLLLGLNNFYLGTKDKIQIFQNKQTSCSLRYHNIFYKNNLSKSTKKPDSIVIEGMNKSKVISQVLRKYDGYNYVVSPSLDKISLLLVGKSDTSKQQIIQQAFGLEFDTTASKKEDSYLLQYKPSAAQLEANKQAQKECTFAGSVNSLAESLTNNFGIHFESQDTNFVFINIPTYNNLDQLKKELELKFGIYVTKSVKERKTIRIDFRS